MAWTVVARMACAALPATPAICASAAGSTAVAMPVAMLSQPAAMSVLADAVLVA